MAVDAYVTILAGGKGERFWPLSTAARPKQFLSLVGDQPLLAQAVARARGLVPPDHIYILTNAEYLDLARQSAAGIPAENIIGEPVGRDTAAAIALAAALVGRRNPRAVFTVLTADHVIGDLAVFHQALRDAIDLVAEQDVLCTMGIQPQWPSPAYGYIEAGALERETAAGTSFFKAQRFVEKPSADKAREYLATGRYYWNSGMFAWSVPAIRAAFARHAPHLEQLVRTLEPVAGTAGFDAVLRAAFADLPKISIDYAVMEKAANVLVIRGRFAWDDVGSWTALENHFAPDAARNVAVGDVQAVDSGHNIVVSQDRLTALVGVDNLVVVQADGVTLVCARDRAQDIKKLLAALRADGRHGGLL